MGRLLALCAEGVHIRPNHHRAKTNAVQAASWAEDRERIRELEATVARLREELAAWRSLAEDFPGAIAPVDDPGGYVYVDEWEAYSDRLNAMLERGTNDL